MRVINGLIYHISRSYMITVVLGDHILNEKEGFEQIFNVSLIIKHYQYSYWMLDNDIMLLKVL